MPRKTYCPSCDTVYENPIVYGIGVTCPVCRGVIQEAEVAEVSGSHASYYIDFSGAVIRTEITCDCCSTVPSIAYFQMHEWQDYYGIDWRTRRDFDILDLGVVFSDGTSFKASPSHRPNYADNMRKENDCPNCTTVPCMHDGDDTEPWDLDR